MLTKWMRVTGSFLEALFLCAGKEEAVPSKPNIPCKHPGCPSLIPCGQKYCEKHKAIYPEEVRSASGRGYGSAWRKARKQFLHTHPLCVECQKEGRYVKATVVDHVVPHRGDADLFWDRSNWQPLCKQCHDRKTMTVDRYQEYRYSLPVNA